MATSRSKKLPKKSTGRRAKYNVDLVPFVYGPSAQEGAVLTTAEAAVVALTLYQLLPKNNQQSAWGADARIDAVSQRL